MSDGSLVSGQMARRPRSPAQRVGTHGVGPCGALTALTALTAGRRALALPARVASSATDSDRAMALHRPEPGTAKRLTVWKQTVIGVRCALATHDFDCRRRAGGGRERLHGEFSTGPLPNSVELYRWVERVRELRPHERRLAAGRATSPARAPRVRPTCRARRDTRFHRRRSRRSSYPRVARPGRRASRSGR
jgi:hypothetical protein